MAAVATEVATLAEVVATEAVASEEVALEEAASEAAASEVAALEAEAKAAEATAAAPEEALVEALVVEKEEASRAACWRTSTRNYPEGQTACSHCVSPSIQATTRPRCVSAR